MQVKKRNGKLQDVSFDKITRRLKVLCSMEPSCDNIDPIGVAQKVCAQIFDGVSTSTLDELAAQLCVSMVTEDPEYGVLALELLFLTIKKIHHQVFQKLLICFIT